MAETKAGVPAKVRLRCLLRNARFWCVQAASPCEGMVFLSLRANFHSLGWIFVRSNPLGVCLVGKDSTVGYWVNPPRLIPGRVDFFSSNKICSWICFRANLGKIEDPILHELHDSILDINGIYPKIHSLGVVC